MQHIQGENRNQMFVLSLESAIANDALVRVIDAFVDAIDLKSFGFSHVECCEEGRPPFHPSVLMKLYLYGYHYGIRTSRKLEREAQTNMEAMWLISGVTPRYKTIADFRKNHSKAFREVFRKFVFLLKEWALIEGETIAIDSFKIRGQNSLKNNFNDKKIERHLAYIDQKIADYEAALDTSDKEEDRLETQAKIQQQKQKRDNYKAVRTALKESGEEQISLTDPDSKAVILHRNIVNVGYNIQASVDAKNKLLVEYDTGDVNDTHALYPMAQASKDLLKVDHLNTIADKGYHTGKQIQQCIANNITTHISPRETATQEEGVFPVSYFTYDSHRDSYTCPAGSILRTNGVWYRHSENRKGQKPGSHRFHRYLTTDCSSCHLKTKCTRNKKNGRAIDRSEYANAIEENNKRVISDPGYYRLRQQIIEHVFGTLKRQRGFTHTIVKGKDNVLAEVAMEFIMYNLRRSISILGIENLIKMLKDKHLLIFMHKFLSILSRLERSFFCNFKKTGVWKAEISFI
jgi:transposase